MYRLERYFELIEKQPHLFRNVESARSIQIVIDPDIIIKQQKRFYQEAQDSQKPSCWFDLGVLAEDQWVIVLRDLIITPNGTYGRYIRLVNKISAVSGNGYDVVILPLLENRILLLRHFRHELRSWSWEIPRGFGEPFLTPEQNARKELGEETGLTVDRMTSIGGVSTDGTYDSVVYFIAQVHGEVTLDAQEAIEEYRTLSVAEMEALILVGTLADAYTIKAYTFAKLRGLLT